MEISLKYVPDASWNILKKLTFYSLLASVSILFKYTSFHWRFQDFYNKKVIYASNYYTDQKCWYRLFIYLFSFFEEIRTDLVKHPCDIVLK